MSEDEEEKNLLIAKADRISFLVTALSLTVGVGFYFNALRYISIYKFSFVTIIIFSGLTPVIMNLRVHSWMFNECKIPHLIDKPSQCDMAVDSLNLVYVLVGIGIIFIAYGGFWTDAGETQY